MKLLPSDDTLAALRHFIENYIENHPEIVEQGSPINISYRFAPNMTKPEIAFNGHPLADKDLNRLLYIIKDLNPEDLARAKWISHAPSPEQPSPQSTTQASVPAKSKDYFVDIFDDIDTLTVIAEIPAITKQEITVHSLSARELEIKTAKFQKTIELPTKIVDTSAKARFLNGILEISFHKQPDSDNSRTITID